MTRPYYPVSGYTRRQYRAQAVMLRLLAGAVLAAVLALVLFASDLARAQAAGPVARFDGGIGVIPATFAGGVAVANDVSPCPVVRTVPPVCLNTAPAGRPWVIADLKGTISGDGTFDVRGKGLLLAGTQNVGRNGGASVILRLYCGVGAAAASFDSTPAVPLEANGDFRLQGQLQFLNPLQECPNAVLLILNNANKGWFAAGIPKN